MRNKLCFALLVSLGCGSAHAQSLERQVIGSGGTFATATWGSLSSTAGESVINTSVTSSLVLTQGFQQPLQTDLAVYSVPSNNISVKVYPVPASDLINVEIDGSTMKHYTVTLFDLPGRVLHVPYQDAGSGTQIKFVFDIHSLAAGAYLLLINDERNQSVKTIKFTKLN